MGLANVVPECYVDTNFIQYLVGVKVNHQHGCGRVTGVMTGKFSNYWAIGIIDDDKKSMPYLKECEFLGKCGHLSFFRHKERCHWLITVHPAIDRFLLDCAADLKVKSADFGLPSKLKDFTEVTKQVSSSTDPRFKNLFRAIDSHPEIVKLRAILRYLIESNFKASVDAVRTMI